jgi:hypothetical protein
MHTAKVGSRLCAVATLPRVEVLLWSTYSTSLGWLLAPSHMGAAIRLDLEVAATVPLGTVLVRLGTNELFERPLFALTYFAASCQSKCMVYSQLT